MIYINRHEYNKEKNGGPSGYRPQVGAPSPGRPGVYELDSGASG